MKYYGYAPDNKQIYRAVPASWGPQENWTFYGAHGERLGEYRMWDTSGTGDCNHCGFLPTAWNVWFGGKLIPDLCTAGGLVPKLT